MTQRLTILVVEDEFLIVFALKAEILARGHAVVGPVHDGEGAVAAAERERPDVVLMDVRIAGPIDGVEAARQIRRFSAAPIFFMSGYSDGITDRVRGLEPVEILQKPFELESLDLELRRYFDVPSPP